MLIILPFLLYNLKGQLALLKKIFQVIHVYVVEGLNFNEECLPTLQLLALARKVISQLPQKMFASFPYQYLVCCFHSSVKCIMHFHCNCMVERVRAIVCMFNKCSLQEMVNNA